MPLTGLGKEQALVASLGFFLVGKLKRVSLLLRCRPQAGKHVHRRKCPRAHGEPVTVAVKDCPEVPDPQVKEEADLGLSTARRGPTPLLASLSTVF